MLHRIALVVALTALAWTGTARALGLGDIELRSALNEPLDAEIELLSVTSEELRSLEVFLAPAATFTRYGLDRPVYLTRIRFDITRTNDGAVVRLTSDAPITEPFVTMLVEANWSRGRLLREYTVLLDPPVFAERATMAPAPQRTAAPRQSGGTVRRPAPADAPAPRRQRTFDGDAYVVQRNDTLWEIAERVRPANDLSTNQVMLALFDANRGAFGGNINLVSAGATLRIPSADEMRGRTRGDALSEVRRQNANWRPTGPATAQQNGTLRLVPVDDAGTTGGLASDRTGGSSGASTSGDVAALQDQLAESERLLAVRDRELAELRARLAAIETGADAAAIIDGPTPDERTDDDAVVSPGVDLEPEPGDDIFVESEPTDAGTDPATVAAVDGGTDTAPADEPPAATTEPTRPTPTPVVAAPEPAPSLIDRALGLFSNIWTWVGLGVVALLLLLPMLARMRRSDDDSTGTWEALDDFEGVDDDSREATSRLRALASDDESIVVVESEKGRTTASLDESLAPAKRDAESSDTYSIEDTFSSETAINLDQSDPIAEADFHMAYGLYDQAADLITGAIASDPARRDLKEKLAEVYFVWGNQDGFVKVAGELREQIGDASDEGWDKIRIMGQQIAPAHELFSGEAPAAALESVDLDFAADGDSADSMEIDFAVEDEGSAELLSADNDAAGRGEAGGLDFEFAATGAHESSQIDLDPGNFFDPADDGPTVERTGNQDDDSPTVERLVDDDSPTVERLADDESPTVERFVDDAATQETPTIENPSVQADASVNADDTSEIDLDDLGLDLAGLEDSAERSAIINMSDIEELDIESSIETLGIGDADIDQIGEQDETLRQPSTGESVTVLAPSANDSNEDTLMAPVDLDDSLIATGSDAETLLAEEPAFSETGDGNTGRVQVIQSEDVDLDLDDLTAALQKTDFANLEDAGDATIERPLESVHKSDLDNDIVADSLAADTELDLDIGMDVEDDDDAPTATRADQVDGEPDNRTMTEVGTKLDLARAYIDMGDPEGARSILREVADEGSSAQQQEARKLLDDLAS
ncbi:MAG: FimV/HubP family polar landmark protein [Pseudomonadota bacterium]